MAVVSPERNAAPAATMDKGPEDIGESVKRRGGYEKAIAALRRHLQNFFAVKRRPNLIGAEHIGLSQRMGEGRCIGCVYFLDTGSMIQDDTQFLPVSVKLSRRKGYPSQVGDMSNINIYRHNGRSLGRRNLWSR